jgi:Kef-type K+ transport system membrane component KefB
MGLTILLVGLAIWLIIAFLGAVLVGRVIRQAEKDEAKDTAAPAATQEASS